MGTCFFIGHRNAPLLLQTQLDKTVEELITNHSITRLIVGHRGTFDQMATAAIQRAKSNHSELRAYRLIAYHPSERPVAIPDSFDGLYFPLALSEVPRRFTIEKANQIVLNESDFLVSYVCRNGGNTSRILQKARRMEKKGLIHVINLGNSELF